MKISKQNRRNAKDLFRACQANGALDENRVREAVRQVIRLKPRGYIGILGHFQRLVKLDLDRRTATVESAVPLAPELSSRVEANLTRAYGTGLSVSFTQNPSLIGGLRIQVGSDVFDGSVRARLDSLTDSF